MPHENRPATASDQFIDTASPGPVLGVRWPGHTWSPDAVPPPQCIAEQRLPVHFASPASGLTSTVNYEDGSGHERKVTPSAQASKKGELNFRLRGVSAILSRVWAKRLCQKMNDLGSGLQSGRKLKCAASAIWTKRVVAEGSNSATWRGPRTRVSRSRLERPRRPSECADRTRSCLRSRWDGDAPASGVCRYEGSRAGARLDAGRGWGLRP